VSRKCSHAWVTNDGRGGQPIFTAPPSPGPEEMRVTCAHCGRAITVTENQWNGFLLSGIRVDSKDRRSRAARNAAEKHYPPPFALRARRPWE
jgi:hypothetical protein